jgi:hypothetical protein
MGGNKFLIIDTSGFDPIRYSITEGYMTMSDLKSFSVQANLQLCITNSVLPEFSYSETPNLFTFRPVQSLSGTASSDTSDQPVKNYWLTSNGTLTIDKSLGKLEFKVFNTDAQTSQMNGQGLSNCLSKLSFQDISNISLAVELLNSRNNAAILVNDRYLRQQAKFYQIPVYGACSFLAGMVLSSIYPYQKATQLYYK